MKFYRLSGQMIKGVMARPKRTEEGIAPKTVVYMKQVGNKTKPHEIWVMVAKSEMKREKDNVFEKNRFKSSIINIVSAWRYPGVTKPGKALPKEILREIAEVE